MDKARWTVALGLLLAACAASGPRAREAGVPAPRVAMPLAEGVHLLPGEFVPGRQPDGNSVMLRGERGWIVVDSGRHAAHARALLDVAARTRRPVTAVLNTHWHLDHVAGNAALRRAYPGVEVHASQRIEAEMGAFLARYRAQLEELARTRPDDPQAAAWREEMARIDEGAALFPTRPVHADGAVRIDGRRLELGLVRDAVSGGDVWVFDVATRTLVAGDLVTLPVPFLDTACPRGWAKALERLDALPFERLVPGHGAPMDRARFHRWRAAYVRLLDCAAGSGEAAACADGWVRDLGDLLAEDQRAFARGLLADYYLPAKLRGQGPLPGYCAAPATPA